MLSEKRKQLLFFKIKCHHMLRDFKFLDLFKIQFDASRANYIEIKKTKF